AMLSSILIGFTSTVAGFSRRDVLLRLWCQPNEVATGAGRARVHGTVRDQAATAWQNRTDSRWGEADSNFRMNGMPAQRAASVSSLRVDQRLVGPAGRDPARIPGGPGRRRTHFTG